MTVRWRGFSMRGGREKLLVIPSSKAMISFCSPGLSPRYAGRKNNSIQQFSMALSLDPLCWEAYGELCSAAEEASSVFGNVASRCLRKTCIAQKVNFSEEEFRDHLTDSDKASKDASLWETEHAPGENQQDPTIKYLEPYIPQDTYMQKFPSQTVYLLFPQ
ncbi:Cell division cycle protein-like protein [Cardamine amara subsp. amara]|uniref:Cell division cycle protein-like protein n=1 Tax=Cardamine amara subsp. amara TaxID=228776 RepID=A0ABD1BLH2_CARAN